MGQPWPDPNFQELHIVKHFLQFIRTQLGQPIILVSLIPGALLLFWRVWTFILKPALHPDEPKELPYWIPCHALGFVKNVQRTLTRGREYFGNTREPFAITMGGQRLYILTHPEDVRSLYKDAKTFTFDDVVIDVSLTFGVSRAALLKMRQKPAFPSDHSIYSELNVQNMHAMSLAELNSEFWKQYLHPGPELEALLDKIMLRVGTILRPQIDPKHRTVQGSSDSTEHLVSLLKWTEAVIMDAGTIVLFGTKILEIDPKLVEKFLAFDNENWKLWYKWPKARKMHAAKAEMMKTIETYLDLPQEEKGSAAQIVKLIEKTTTSLGLSKCDIAASLAMIYFVFNTNTYKVCFWTLSHLLYNPSLLDRTRRETESAFHNGKLDLEGLADSSLLDALVLETLRFYSASYSIRTVAQPTILGGKKFERGSRIIAPFRQLHFDHAVYGHDDHVFDPERFLRDKTLARGTSFRPFGGGTSYCPGRFLAKQEVKMFIALVLHRFELSLEGKQDFPMIEVGQPTTGIAGPMARSDVTVRIKALN